MKTWIEINSENLKHNLTLFRKLAEKKKVLFAVKANAYGHGLEEIVSITKKLDLIDYYGVDSYEEAEKVRKIDKSKNILILGWMDDGDISDAVVSGMEFVAPSLEYLLKTDLISESLKCKAKVHLKIETGTSRLGINPEDFPGFIQSNDLKNIEFIGVYSHFANIEDTTDHSYAMGQLKKFKNFLDKFDKMAILKHFSCSASALLFPETYFDMIRVGISGYGLWPSKQTFVSFAEKKENDFSLKPVLNWNSKIAQIKLLKSGTPVSYGLSYKTFNKSVIAVIPVGYYDGYDRKLSNIANVIINDKIAPVRGRVCMNMFMVDVTHIKNVKAGDKVIIIGGGEENVSADKLAELAGTINYELLARINPLIPRVIV